MFQRKPARKPVERPEPQVEVKSTKPVVPPPPLEPPKPRYVVGSGWVEVSGATEEAARVIRGVPTKSSDNFPNGTRAVFFDLNDGVVLPNGNYCVHREDIAAFEILQ